MATQLSFLETIILRIMLLLLRNWHKRYQISFGECCRSDNLRLHESPVNYNKIDPALDYISARF